MKLKSTLILILLFILSLYSGCVDDDVSGRPDKSYPTDVIITFTYSFEKVHSNSFPVKLHFDATNVGETDAKNVEAIFEATYDGNPISEKKFYFGTVKIGMPIQKDTYIDVVIPLDEWESFDKTKLNFSIQKIIINGEELELYSL